MLLIYLRNARVFFLLIVPLPKLVLNLFGYNDTISHFATFLN